MNAPQDSSSVSKYYTLAHAVNERVTRQPSMLKCGTLRDYQLVGLQWMLSLYNNKLNGILADEMGLGKTVQVMALIAYLMEFKSNYGPHLIIVPNVVLVNWKSELHSWLPNVSCIYYVGNKGQRAKLFSQEVCAMKFNVLVTTYEFVMFYRGKLSRVDWKYIIIDEAQRMKDRESVLARDLDKYRCQRRLLLTGTPLQNDLNELWALLNLLLPEVFDNRKAFHDWFSKPFQKEVAHNGEDDWLETEKKVIIIHRLNQILEPFMLRRRVEDVEGSLPPQISIILWCKMLALQSAGYDWIKSTGTIRVDPEDEKRKAQKSLMYQPKTFKPLNNKCMELRKDCNHPLLSYPYFNDFSKDLIVEPCRSAHLKAMEVAKDAGALLSYDPNLRLPLWPSPEEAREQIMSIWNKAQVIKVSDNELEFLTGSDKIDDEAAMSLWHPNLKLLLVTLGDKVCNYYTKDFETECQKAQQHEVGAGYYFEKFLATKQSCIITSAYERIPKWLMAFIIKE